jgi:antitoxin VapB
MKVAKVFQSGGSQAVRLPKECRFEGKEVHYKKIGPALILLPTQGSWEILFQACREFAPEFMSVRRQPKLEKRLSLRG